MSPDDGNGMMAKKLVDKLRKDLTVYGPYTRKDGRKVVIIYDGVTRRTMSYPKWVKEQSLGKKLKKEDTIHHKNRDFTDDRPDNLEILDHSTHGSLDATRVKLVLVKCVWCDKEFTTIPRDRNRGKAGPFCSRRCVGQYGKHIELGGKVFPKKEIKSEYYVLSEIGPDSPTGRDK